MKRISLALDDGSYKKLEQHRRSRWLSSDVTVAAVFHDLNAAIR
ncbi:MAG: hypothetical protein RXR02_07040 [Thermoproteus sp.]